MAIRPAVPMFDLPPGTGDVAISLANGKAEEILAAVDSLYLRRDDTVKGVIIDLRGNPGRLVGEAASIANLFLPSGHLIVGVKGRSRWHRTAFYSNEEDITGGLPMAIIVDRGSASASEIFAGAMKYSGRGFLVGTRSCSSACATWHRWAPLASFAAPSRRPAFTTSSWTKRPLRRSCPASLPAPSPRPRPSGFVAASFHSPSAPQVAVDERHPPFSTGSDPLLPAICTCLILGE